MARFFDLAENVKHGNLKSIGRDVGQQGFPIKNETRQKMLQFWLKLD